VAKPDDSSLTPDQLRAVLKRAKQLLDRASVWERYPTPIADILEEAKLKVAPVSVFDPASILAYIKNKTADAAHRIKHAIAKMFGVYDAEENVIHIDHTVKESKQNFLKLHETGHHEIPTHKKAFRFFQDCEKTLAPDIADLFEREANNFARYVLFQGDGFAKLAADCTFEIKTPIKLAKKFGASVYASAREFARTSQKACLVYILEPIEFVEGVGARAIVRRVEPSPAFRAQFGCPDETVITLDHVLGQILPIGRKMTRPRTLPIFDLNGTEHECVAEAFDTTFNVLLLVYPTRALTSTTIIMPSTYQSSTRSDS
jgi:Zn-dependent peptidase ImmA (M78 family)